MACAVLRGLQLAQLRECLRAVMKAAVLVPRMLAAPNPAPGAPPVRPTCSHACHRDFSSSQGKARRQPGLVRRAHACMATLSVRYSRPPQQSCCACLPAGPFLPPSLPGWLQALAMGDILTVQLATTLPPDMLEHAER